MPILVPSSRNSALKERKPSWYHGSWNDGEIERRAHTRGRHAANATAPR